MKKTVKQITKKEQQTSFLKTLQSEANWQSALQDERLIPKKLSSIASFFVLHLWQFLLILAAAAALVYEFVFYESNRI